MNKNLIIVGANSFFGNAILGYVLKKKKFYKNKFQTITLLSRNFNKIKNNSKQLEKYFKIIYFKKDILKLKKLPISQFIIYCALLSNYKKDFFAAKHFLNIYKKSNNNSRIVFTSSGAVYGNDFRKLRPVKEKFISNNNFNFLEKKKIKYAFYKMQNEKVFKKISEQGSKVSILRCFAFVGKDLPLNKNFVVGNFINCILKSKKIIVKNKSKVTRSYMHQDDLANWIISILLNNNKKFSIFNVGSDDPITIHELGLKLSKKFKIKLKSNYKESKLNDYYLPNIDKAKKQFNLKLKYKSINSIYKTINELKYK